MKKTHHHEYDRSFLLWMNDIAYTPFLTPKEERRLGYGARVYQDPECISRLVSAHLPLSIAVAKRFDNRLVSHPELVSAGNEGLATGVLRFDERKDVRFITYIWWWIKKYVWTAYLHEGRTIAHPTPLLRAGRDLDDATWKFWNSRGRFPDITELAKCTGMSEARICRIRQELTSTVSLDTPWYESGTTLLEVLPADQESTDSVQRHQDLREAVDRALSILPVPELIAVTTYLGFTGIEDATHEDSAHILNVSQERARIYYHRGIDKLRKHRTKALLKKYA